MAGALRTRRSTTSLKPRRPGAGCSRCTEKRWPEHRIGEYWLGRAKLAAWPDRANALLGRAKFHVETTTQKLKWYLISPARQTAFDVLRKVQQGGYASDLLLKHSAKLDSRDAALASEIVFGCLRYQAQLDHVIGLLTTGKLDPEVRIALSMGIYQIRYLERVPPHAAVTESVELVKRARKWSASGLVNAVLRKVDRKPIAWPD